MKRASEFPRLSEFRWTKLIEQLEHGAGPKEAYLARALRESVEAGWPVPREALLYVADYFDKLRPRGRPKKPPKRLVDDLKEALEAAQFILDVERIKEELKASGKPHTRETQFAEYKKLYRRPSPETVRRDYQRAQQTIRPYRNELKALGRDSSVDAVFTELFPLWDALNWGEPLPELATK